MHINLPFKQAVIVIWILALTLTACASRQGTTPESLTSLQTLIEPTTTVSALAPAASEAAASEDSLAIVFVRDGNIQVWHDEITSIQTIYSAGDALGVWASDDGELVAFTRRSIVQVSELEWFELSSLMVMDNAGNQLHEIISAGDMRQRLGANDRDSTDIVQVRWLPDTHSLIYSGMRYLVQAEGASHAYPEGIYLFDADMLTDKVLIPAGESLRSAVSPNGRQIAIITTTGLSFFNLDDGSIIQAGLTYPEVGLAMPILPRGVWTLDSQTFLLVAPSEIDEDYAINFTIWRVPLDGASAQPLATMNDTSSESVTFSPDGRYASFYRSKGWQPDLFGWFIIALDPETGPIATPQTIEFGFANLHWSPGGDAYILKGDQLLRLCPEAAQDTDVCGQSVGLPDGVNSIRWIDSGRFMVSTNDPAKLYLGQIEGPMIPVGEGQSFVAIRSACSNRSELVTGVISPESDQVMTNELFERSWRLRNSGTCTWDGSYRLSFLSGDRMMGPHSIPLAQQVQPGEEIELSIQLIAPDQGGIYLGQWQLTTPDGDPFGTNVEVRIELP